MINCCVSVFTNECVHTRIPHSRSFFSTPSSLSSNNLNCKWLSIFSKLINLLPFVKSLVYHVSTNYAATEIDTRKPEWNCVEFTLWCFSILPILVGWKWEMILNFENELCRVCGTSLCEGPFSRTRSLNFPKVSLCGGNTLALHLSKLHIKGMKSLSEPGECEIENDMK